MPEVRLAARVDGPEHAPVLVLGGPIGTNAGTWRHQLPVLSRHFRVIRFEHRGHGPPGGQSPGPAGPYSIAELGADVLGLLGALEVERFGYAGASLGGMIGIWLAANAPERVASLAVVCTALVPLPSAQAWRTRVAVVRSRGTAAIAGEAVPRWFTPRFIARFPEVVAAVVDDLGHTSPEGYAGCGDAIASMDLRPLLPAVRAPTLIVSGAEDPAAPPSQGAEAALGIPGARLRVVRGASHFAHLETPGPVTNEIERHFNATL